MRRALLPAPTGLNSSTNLKPPRTKAFCGIAGLYPATLRFWHSFCKSDAAAIQANQSRDASLRGKRRSSKPAPQARDHLDPHALGDTPLRSSPSAQPVKDSMFDFMEKLLRKTLEAVLTGPRHPVRAIPPLPNAPGSRPKPSSDDSKDPTSLRLPLQVILPGLPAQLRSRLRHGNPASLTVSIPLQAILPQLARNTVQIPFGTLRQAAPGVFSPDADGDNVLITLPLPEILSRLDLGLIARRHAPNRLEVPDDIINPFLAKNRALTISAEPPKPQPVQFRRDRIPREPAPPPPEVVPPEPPATIPDSLPPASRSEVDRPCTLQPAEPADESGFLMLSLNALAGGWPGPVRTELAQLNLTCAKVALPVEVARQALKGGRLAFNWKTLRAWLKPALPPSISAHDEITLELPLKVVAPLYLAKQRNAGKAKIKLTVSEEIPDLFSGPAQLSPDRAPEPLHTDTANPQPAQKQAALTLAGDRPMELPEVDMAASPVAARQPVSNPSTPGSPAQGGDSFTALGTRFASSPSTPHGVVFRCVALKGVAGALIVSADGLAVTSSLPEDLNADTLAAFVPQIFCRISQSTNELALGELTNVVLTLGNVPWQILRVRNLFLAALGYVGETLPVALLANLAAELETPN